MCKNLKVELRHIATSIIATEVVRINFHSKTTYTNIPTKIIVIPKQTMPIKIGLGNPYLLFRHFGYKISISDIITQKMVITSK